MEPERIDVSKLKEEINKLAAQIKEYKDEGCCRGDLGSEKRRATLMCAIRAHSRGKLHFSAWPRKAHSYLGLPPEGEMSLELQEKWIGDRWEQFEVEEEQVEVAAS